MLRSNSPVVRLLSPMLCVLLGVLPLLNAAAQNLGSDPNIHNESSEVVSGGASASRPNSVIKKSQIGPGQSAAVVPEVEPIVSGSLGGGCTATTSHRSTLSRIPSGTQSTQYGPDILRKTGVLRSANGATSEESVIFDVGNLPGILLLSLDMNSEARTPLNEASIELVSGSNNVLFSLHKGRATGANLVSITARDLDSLARIDHQRLADSLAKYDRLVIMNEELHKVILLDFNPSSGKMTLRSGDLDQQQITYSMSSIPFETLVTLDGCDICQTIMGFAAYLVSELACSASPYAAPVVICIVSLKFWALIPLCVSSISFVDSWHDILGKIICHLSEDLRRSVEASITSWFCTKIGACDDSYPPVVFLHSPSNGDLYSGTLAITATVAGEASAIDHVEFDYSTNGGSSWFDVVGPGHSNGTVVFEGEGSILFDTKSAGIDYSTSMKVRVRAADTEGNVSDWVESDGLFTVDNRSETPSSITVTANLNPSTTTPNSLVQVSGYAYYDIGGPAYPATAKISVGGRDWTAAIQSNGSFSRNITAPSSEGTYSVSIVISDGSIDGSTSRQLIVDDGAQTSGCWTFEEALTCRDYDSDWQPIDITQYFRSDDMKVQTWVHLRDVYLDESCKSNLVRVKCEYYRPDGSLHYSPITHTIPDPGDGYYWVDYYTLAHYSVAGYDMSDMEGKWTIKVYVSSRGDFRLVKVLSFTLRYEFGSHLMAEDIQPSDPWDPINPKNSFCQTDNRALTWAQVFNVCEDLEVRWNFIEPTGSLYGTANFSVPDPGTGSPDEWWKIWGWTNIYNAGARYKTGAWRVDVFIQDVFGNWDLEYSDNFNIRECPGVNPALTVSASPHTPNEGNIISLNVLAADNGYLESVTINWNDGAPKSHTWTDIKANSFSNSVPVGSFSTPISIPYYATGQDADGNIGRSATQIVTVRDTDTEGPSITSLVIEESSGNGNGLIEDYEKVYVGFSVSDPSGVDSVSLVVDSTEVSLNGSYFAVLGPLQSGEHYITILALDADEPPAGRVVVDTFTVVKSITDVDESQSPELPDEYALYQNFPNPFNPETRIEFAIPRASYVEIHIYNVLGERLRTLVEEHLSAGQKIVTWGGKDDDGRPVSSGVYFYRIVTDGYTETKKMLLLK